MPDRAAIHENSKSWKVCICSEPLHRVPGTRKTRSTPSALDEVVFDFFLFLAADRTTAWYGKPRGSLDGS